MRILHINSYYYKGGFYKDLYDAQIAHGADISVFTSVHFGAKGSGRDYGEFTTVSKNHFKAERYVYFSKQYHEIKDLFTKYNVGEYDVLHGHSLFTNGYICQKVKDKYGTPYVVAVRSTDVNYFFPYAPHLRSIGRRILKDADKVVFISDATKENLVNKYLSSREGQMLKEKSVTIPNGTNGFWRENIVEERPPINIKEREKTNMPIKLIFVGRVNGQKNIRRTILAIEELREEGLNIELTVVGKCKSIFLRSNIDRREWINYVSHVPKEMLLPLYQNSDIFIMNSHKETFGIVYLEAMSQGLPLVYSSGEGFSSYFDEGRVGFQAPYDDTKAIGVAIKKAIKNYDQISKNCIREFAEFNWQQIAAKYIDIYKQINNS